MKITLAGMGAYLVHVERVARSSFPWCTALLTCPIAFDLRRGRIQRHPGRLPVRLGGSRIGSVRKGSITWASARLFVDDGLIISIGAILPLVLSRQPSRGNDPDDLGRSGDDRRRPDLQRLGA